MIKPLFVEMIEKHTDLSEELKVMSEGGFTSGDMATQAAQGFRDGYRQALQDIASNLLQPLAQQMLEAYEPN